MRMIYKLIDKIFPKRLLFMILSPNSVFLKDIETGKTISKKSLTAFSNDRLIISDFIIAEQFLREVLDEFYNEKGKVFRKSMKIVLQIIDKDKPIVTNVERRIYQDLVLHMGAAYFWLIEHQNNVNDTEIIEISNKAKM